MMALLPSTVLATCCTSWLPANRAQTSFASDHFEEPERAEVAMSVLLETSIGDLILDLDGE